MLAGLVALSLAVASPFVAARDAGALVAAGATVLDARDGGFEEGHLPGARSIDWKDYRDGWGRTGRLDDDAARMAKRLAALGVDEARPVLVYGDAQRGFGEEGRIAWMLAYLGHREARILDGGFAAWRAAGFPVEKGRAGPPRAGRFAARPRPELRAERGAVEEVVASGAATLLDVRTRAEFDGATPHFERRGGHVPGARHLEWTRFLDGEGRLLSANEIARRLADAGVDDKKPIVVYCTGGVRSAFAWAALVAAGRDAKNYDGSWYDWSRR